jgi:hypothetical protein
MKMHILKLSLITDGATENLQPKTCVLTDKHVFLNTVEMLNQNQIFVTTFFDLKMFFLPFQGCPP